MRDVGCVKSDGLGSTGKHANRTDRFNTLVKQNWWKYALFADAILLTIAIASHEPWEDELQAWLLARDSTPITLFLKYLRYEGHPGLWHIILMVPAKLGLPPFTMNIICGLLMLTSVYLILRYSPFPTYVKILLPFTYYFFYQYGVIARSYVLIPLLLFLIAIIYPKKTQRFYLYVFLLCLLANVSIHGTLIAISLLLVHTLDIRRQWQYLSRPVRKSQLIGGAIFVIVLLLIVAILWPPADIRMPNTGNTLLYKSFNVANSLRTSINFISMSQVSAAYMDSGGPYLVPFWALSILLLALILLWFHRRRVLKIYLMLVLPLLAFFMFVTSAARHSGILFVVLVFVYWISLEQPLAEDGEATREYRLLRKSAIVSFLVILAVQLGWSASSFRNEIRWVYSPAQEMAEFIKDNKLENRKIYILGEGTDFLAFFDRNIIHNFNNGEKPCFLLWSTKNYHMLMTPENLRRVLKEKPDVLITNYWEMPKNKLQIDNYYIASVFPGGTIWKNKAFANDTRIIYVRDGE